MKQHATHNNVNKNHTNNETMNHTSKKMTTQCAFVALITVFLFTVLVNPLQAYAATSGGASVVLSLPNYDPSPARAGDAITLHFRVTNEGSTEANNVQIQVVDSYPFTAVETTPKTFTLFPFQTDKNAASFDYTVKVDKDAKNGNYQLKVKIGDANGAVTANYTITVTNKEFAQIIYVDRSQLSPGAETPINFTITNIGNAPLQNMIFSWTDAKGYVLPVYSDNTKYIKSLDVGESVVLSYIVIADINAPQGLDQLDLVLNYESVSTATPSTLKTTAGIFIGGQTDFDIAFSESTQGQTSLSVANTGNNPASAVSVRIPQQPGFIIGGTNSAIIGNLNKGDYTLVSFQITPSGNGSRTGTGATGGSGTRGSGQIPTTPTTGQQGFPQGSFNGTRGGGNNSNMLRVNIDYTDTTGARRTVEKMVPIQLRTSTGTTGTGAYGQQTTTQTSIWQSTTYWIVIAAVVIVGAVLYRRKKPGK